MVNSLSATVSPQRDPKGFAAIAILGAALSLLTTGYVFGTKNNLFHLPIVAMLFDEPQFQHDAFIQSLRFYAAGPFLLLQGADRYVDPAALFLALDALSRLIAFTGFLACATLLGITSRRDRIIFTVLIAFSRILAGSSYAGDGGLFINYFTHAEFANGTSLLALYCAVRARIVAAVALNGLVFFCSDFAAAWNAVPLALLFASQVIGRRISLVRLLGRGAVGIGIFAVLAAPVLLAVIASPDFGRPVGFDYRTYLDQFWPFHFLFNSIPVNQKLGLLALILTGSVALLAIGDSARPFLLAFGGYILVYAIGIVLPMITDNATLLNLHLLQSGSAIHLLTALATCALATRLMRSTDWREVAAFWAGSHPDAVHQQARSRAVRRAGCSVSDVRSERVCCRNCGVANAALSVCPSDSSARSLAPLDLEATPDQRLIERGDRAVDGGRAMGSRQHSAERNIPDSDFRLSRRSRPTGANRSGHTGI